MSSLPRTCMSMLICIPKIRVATTRIRTAGRKISWQSTSGLISIGLVSPGISSPAAWQDYEIVCLSSVSTRSRYNEEDRPITTSEARKMRISNLREALSRRGLPSDGTKADLLERLLAAIEVTRNTLSKSGTHREEYDTNSIATKNMKAEHILQSAQQPREKGQRVIPNLNPQRTYIIRIKSAPSGQMRIVAGVGIGMTLIDDKSLEILERNQLLLPGSRNPFEAEYSALVMAMRYAKDRGIRNLIMEIESIGIIRQLEGLGRIGKASIQQELHCKSLELKNCFECCEIRVHSEAETCPETTSLARSALAKQQNVECDWDMIDPITEEPALNSRKENCIQSIDPNREYLLRFDGGARGNPSVVAGAGMVIYGDLLGQNEVWCGWDCLGPGKTNNIAEYEALLQGLECAHRLGIRRIRVQGDSQLVVRQVMGEYKVKKEHLRPFHQRIVHLQRQFDSFLIEYIPRAENKRADFLANHAMDEQTSSSLDQLPLP